MMGADRAQCRPGGATGRQPVVDDYHRTPGEIERPASPIALNASVDLGSTADDRSLQFLSADPEFPDRIWIEHADVALSDRADPVLRVVGGPDLAHHEHVKRRPKRLGNLIGDGDATARESEDHRVFRGECSQVCREFASRGATVDKRMCGMSGHWILVSVGGAAMVETLCRSANGLTVLGDIPRAEQAGPRHPRAQPGSEGSLECGPETTRTTPARSRIWALSTSAPGTSTVGTAPRATQSS